MTSAKYGWRKNKGKKAIRVRRSFKGILSDNYL